MLLNLAQVGEVDSTRVCLNNSGVLYNRTVCLLEPTHLGIPYGTVI